MAGRNGKKRFSRGAGPASLHIKKNTAGTSNELSLSVMDALSSKADEAEGQARLSGFLGDVSLFTFPGKRLGDPTPKTTDYLPGSDAPAPSTSGKGYTAADIAGLALELSSREASRDRHRAAAIADPEAEIRRRKKARRIRRVATTVAGIVCSAAIVGAFGMYLYKTYEDHAGQMELLHQGISALESADEVIVAMDALVTSSVTEESLAQMADIETLVGDAEIELNEAETLARKAGRFMLQGADKEACNQLEAAVAARRDMLGHAQSLMEADRNAAAASASIEECWDLVLEADALAREAAGLVTDTTNENVAASQEKTEQALEKFTAARSKLDEASASYASADFSVLRSYIDTRIEAMGYAIASDEAIYIQDKATADEQNALYNEADAKAAELATQLPANPTDPVVQAYETNIQGLLEDYQAARTRAGTADAFLRDYLGDSTV